MSRFVAAALAALAYLSALLLMPALPAQAQTLASPATMPSMTAPAPCDMHGDHAAPAKPVPPCPMNCAAAHAPALPAQAVAAPMRWSRQASLSPAAHPCPVSTIVAPDPRPPRLFSVAL